MGEFGFTQLDILPVRRTGLHKYAGYFGRSHGFQFLFDFVFSFSTLIGQQFTNRLDAATLIVFFAWNRRHNQQQSSQSHPSQVEGGPNMMTSNLMP